LATLAVVGRTRYAIAVALTALVLAGCGGGSDDDDKGQAQATTPGGTTTQPEDSGAGGGNGGSGGSDDQGSDDRGSGSGGVDAAPGTGGSQTPSKRRRAKRRAERERKRSGSQPGSQEKKSGGGKRQGSGGGSPAGQPAPIAPDTTKTGADRYRGTARAAYESAKLVCGSGDSPADVAHDLGIKARDIDGIAREYAQEYPPQFRRAAIEGCEAGLK
jgi:hypothetical protein